MASSSNVVISAPVISQPLVNNECIYEVIPPRESHVQHYTGIMCVCRRLGRLVLGMLLVRIAHVYTY